LNIFVHLFFPMKKNLIIMLGMLLLAMPSFAQRRLRQMDAERRERPDTAAQYGKLLWRDKVKFGGGVSAYYLGSGYSYFYVQPFVAYKVTEKLLSGAGITYMYMGQTVQTYSGNYTYSDNIWGLNFFANHLIAGSFCAHVEYMPVNFTSYNFALQPDHERVWGQSFFVGGGLRNTNSYLLVLYDLMWTDPNAANPYAYSKTFRNSPIDFRVGFLF
jgi:hypothetical protein